MNISAVNIDSCHLMVGVERPFMFIINQEEKLVESIISCAKKTNLKSASLSGLGALKCPTLGFYDLETRKYRHKKFEGFFEVVAFNGNITLYDDAYVAHIHVALSDCNYTVIAGHLIEAWVGVTAEITINPFDTQITRSFNTDFSVPLVNTAKSYR